MKRGGPTGAALAFFFEESLALCSALGLSLPSPFDLVAPKRPLGAGFLDIEDEPAQDLLGLFEPVV
jgi:hypothetical protein